MRAPKIRSIRRVFPFCKACKICERNGATPVLVQTKRYSFGFSSFSKKRPKGPWVRTVSPACKRDSIQALARPPSINLATNSNSSSWGADAIENARVWMSSGLSSSGTSNNTNWPASKVKSFGLVNRKSKTSFPTTVFWVHCNAYADVFMRQ